MTHRGRHSPSRGEDGRGVEDEGHAEGGLVGEQTVRLLSVLSKALPVVGGEDDQGARGRALGEEGSQQGLEGRIGCGYLAVVGVCLELLVERGRGLVREVGLVEVEEAEPLGALLALDPAQSGGHRP